MARQATADEEVALELSDEYIREDQARMAEAEKKKQLARAEEGEKAPGTSVEPEG